MTENNIDYQTYFTESNETIIIAINNNEKNVEIDIEIEFYDKNKKLVGVESNSVDVSSKGSKFALNFSEIPKSYDSYKVYIDIEEIDVSSFVSNLKSESQKNTKMLLFKLKIQQIKKLNI